MAPFGYKIYYNIYDANGDPREYNIEVPKKCMPFVDDAEAIVDFYLYAYRLNSEKNTTGLLRAVSPEKIERVAEPDKMAGDIKCTVLQYMDSLSMTNMMHEIEEDKKAYAEKVRQRKLRHVGNEPTQPPAPVGWFEWLRSWLPF